METEESIFIDDLTDYNDLSYTDNGDDTVEVYHKGVFVGNAKVWTDSELKSIGEELSSYEYIIINYEMIHFYKIKKNQQ